MTSGIGVLDTVGSGEREGLDLPHYEEELFFSVTEADKAERIPQFCNAIFRHNLSETAIDLDKDLLSDCRILEDLLNKLPCPFTIVQEFHHIDRCFRDSYYAYFSNQHFQMKRYSRRLSFFKGTLDRDVFFDEKPENQERVRASFLGTCVINPLATGAIGRTLLHPNCVLDESEKPAFVRLSEFSFHVYGNLLKVRAFPYRMQDEETMRCGEVTLLNLLEYYSNDADDYRFITPSEILASEQRHNHERVLPARGITYPLLTKVLSEFGFSPRLYNLSSIDSFSLSQSSQADELKRWLHYYIESGIPVAVNLNPTGNNGPGHSVVCIGHGRAKFELAALAEKKERISWEHRGRAHPIINSADFFDDYVIVDDNQPVYQVRSFQQMSQYPEMRVENIAVPLYKRMFLDAPDASELVYSILHHEHFGITAWASGELRKGEAVVMRLFMAASHSLKSYRSASFSSEFAKEAYTLVPMPRFVWVCELYHVEDYLDPQTRGEPPLAFAEIVIDATTAPSRGQSYRSMILMHYPGALAFRHYDQREARFSEMVSLQNDGHFPGFSGNLDYIP